MKRIAGVVPSEILIVDDHVSQHTVVLGKTRSGKSSVMRVCVEELLRRKKPVCIVDPKGDWWGIKLAADGKSAGYPVVIFGTGERADVPITEHAGAQVAELFATGNRPCLIDLGGWMPGPRTRFWIDFASTLFKLTKGDRWLVIDEVHNFAPKGKVLSPQAGEALHWTNRLASEGLGKGIGMLIASQRPQKVHNDTLTSAETLIAMRVLHPSDRSAVSDWIKGCGDAAGDQVLSTLSQMQRGEGWVWSPEVGFGPERVQFPMFTTYDSFRPQSVAESKRLKGWAAVDLDEVREKMAAVVEEATANDPYLLKQRIEQLEIELRVGGAVEKGARGREQQLAVQVDHLKARTEALREALKQRYDGNIQRLESAARDLAAVAEKIPTLIDPLAQAIRAHAAALADEPFELELREPTPTSFVPSAPRREPRKVVLPANGGEPGGAVRGQARAILAALAQYGPKRKENLTMLAGYPWNGTFRTRLGELRAVGYVEGGNSDTMCITPKGRAALGPVEPLPKPGPSLAAFWLDKFSGQARVILAAVLKHPGGLTQSNGEGSLITATGYPWNGTFRTRLGELRRFGVILGSNAHVKPHPDLIGG